MKTNNTTITKKVVQVSDEKLSTMLKFVIDKHNTCKTKLVLLSLQIEKEFGIYCPASRIEEYMAKISFVEDFEKEGRKVQYGYRM